MSRNNKSLRRFALSNKVKEFFPKDDLGLMINQ